MKSGKQFEKLCLYELLQKSNYLNELKVRTLERSNIFIVCLIIFLNFTCQVKHKYCTRKNKLIKIHHNSFNTAEK